MLVANLSVIIFVSFESRKTIDILIFLNIFSWIIVINNSYLCPITE